MKTLIASPLLVLALAGCGDSLDASTWASPTPTGPSQHDLAQRYERVLNADKDVAVSALDGLPDCDTEPTVCRLKVVDELNALTDWQADLRPLAVPQCYTAANAAVLAGLDRSIQGWTQVKGGLDTYIAQGGQHGIADVHTGAAVASDGKDQLSRAGSLFAQANCP